MKPLRPKNKNQYYRIRNDRSHGRLKRAAEFVYLNKTCWNGLYRVNSSGEFNVPYGSPRTNTIVDPTNLRACSTLLRQPGIRLLSCDFESALADTAEDDLVFLDPPYVTGHNNNGFVDYNETLFSWSDQLRLASVAARLADRGANVVVTNACHDDVLNLYDGFQVRPIDRASTLASNRSYRGRVREAVLWRQP